MKRKILQSVASASSDASDIAIIGMACRFPGAPDPAQFWSNLRDGVCSVSQVPADRWSIDNYYSPDINEPGKSISKWGGWVDSIQAFDHGFFNISPREAASMDPQQRLLLEEVWHCIEDSGVPLSELSRKITSAYIGVMAVNYGPASADAVGIAPDAYGCSGAYECMLANRLSFYFGFRGNSQPINTACSSSLVALHEAKKALLLGEADYALVAGVGANVSPYKYISFSKARMLSPDGLCKTFDKDANGYVPGEGAGVLLLRRLSDAIRAGNRIYGIVKGTAVNHGGRSNSLTAPRVEAQRDVILSAWRDARVSGETISYIEAHGTGTSLGDPIEVEALSQAFHRYTKAKQFAGLGSVKTNIGHLEAAAGIAGLLKVLLMMKHKAIAQTLHLKTVNPMIDFGTSPLQPALTLRPWDPQYGPLRRAGISSFGFGGVNAHVVIEEYLPTEPNMRLAPNTEEDNRTVRPLPFVLSAKTVPALNALADSWRTLAANEALDGGGLQNACRTLTVSREQFPYRLGALVTGRKDLARALDLFRAEPKTSVAGPIILRLGEADTQVFAAAEAVKRQDPVIAKLIERCEREARLLAQSTGLSTERIAEFASLYALSKRLLQLISHPIQIAGEGMGYPISLALAGCITRQDAFALACTTDSRVIAFRRPKHPYYDPQAAAWRLPLQCDSSYIARLVNDAEVTPEEATFYINKSRALVENQFTFRRYLEEWTREGSTGDIYSSLSQWTPSQPIPATRLLVIALASCLRRLNRKWRLPDSAFHSSSTTELLNLLTDEVLTISDAIGVLEGGENAYEAAARTINSRLENIDRSKSYSLLRSWTGRSNVTDLSYPANHILPVFDPNWLCVDIGRLTNCSGTALTPARYEAGSEFAAILLDCWKRGVTVNWRAYGWRTGRHIDLPTYPFRPVAQPNRAAAPAQLESKVVRQTDNLPAEIQETVIPTPPLESKLKRKVGDVNGLAAYSRVVDAAKDPIVGDHVISGRILVPGALMIDLMVEAARKERGAENAAISSIAFISAAAVDSKLTLTAEINAAASKAVFRNEGTLTCSARLGKAGYAASEMPGIAMDHAPDKPWHNSAWLYNRLQEFGYMYGETLRVIRKLWITDESFICDVQEQTTDEGHGSGLSPFLLDGVFQCAIAAGLAESGIAPANHIYVPYLIDALEVVSPLSGACRVVIHRRDVSVDDAGVRADIAVFDGNGAPVLRIRRLFLKSIPQTVPQPRSVQLPNVLAQSPVWQVRGLPGNVGAAPIAIIAGGSDSHSAALAARLTNGGADVYRIRALGEEVEPAIEEHLRALKPSATTGSPLAIYYLNALDGGTDLSGMEAVRNRQQQCLKPLLHIARALSRRSRAHRVRVIAATHNAQNVVGTDTVRGFADGGLTGLGKVLAAENKNVSFTAVDLDDDGLASNAWVQHLTAEGCGSDAVDVAYRDGVRYVRELKNVPLVHKASSRPTKAGLYVVSGGAGGIGMQICRKMAELYRGTVIVIGRSELKAPQAKEFEELQKSGLNVQYVRGDVADTGTLGSVLQNLRAEHGPIRGVVHCAGVLEDKLILNKDWSSFERVLTPKAYGVSALDMLTSEDPLEIFAVFSSVVSLTGNMGQSDYAAANSLLDSFVHYRNRCGRPGRTVGINWTLWTGVGMGANDRAAAQIEKMGIRALDHKTAVDAFALTLNTTGQVAILGPERSATQPNSEVLESGDSIAKESPVMKPVEPEAADAIYSRVAEVVAKTLSCSPNDLDADTDFSEYGMDSVAVITLVSELEAELGTTLHHSAVLEHPTLRQLAAYVNKQTPRPVMAIPSVKAEEKPAVSPQPPTLHTNGIEATVLEIAASTLGASTDDLDLDTDLSEYGLDSVGIVSIVSAAEDQFHIRLHHSALVENNTIRGFASHIRGEVLRQTPAVASVPAVAPVAPDPVPQPAITPTVSVSLPHTSRHDIAVIGMACRFPKSPTLEQFWANLTGGNDLISPVPEDRWKVRDYYSPTIGEPKKTYSTCGGFLEGIDLFDAGFFKVSDTEATEMDPQQRVFLELTQELLDRSGYPAAQVAGSRTAVLIGGHESEYGRRDRRRNKFEGKHGVVNVISNMIAGRVADHYNFHGPAETIYTACSSSLVAVHHACQMLRYGDCDMAIAGGIELLLNEEWFVGFSQSKVLSPDGKCFVFDQKANGFVLGEGAGAVLLKPLERALADGDQVYAVIRGSAVNNDGRTMGLTTPNMKAQKDAVRQALIRADIDPQQIGYYEAHGTGTALGDPIEIKAATEVFREFTDARGYCATGSVKSNMGHALAAAGIAGFIKVVLTLKNAVIPPTLHCESPHPRFDFEKSPFFPVTKRSSWPSNKQVSAASISSFGFGGTNCHVVLSNAGAAVGGYSPTRNPLPVTNFNRKRYWLSSPESSTTALKLRVLFEQVASGKIAQDKACEHLHAATRIPATKR